MTRLQSLLLAGVCGAAASAIVVHAGGLMLLANAGAIIAAFAFCAVGIEGMRGRTLSARYYLAIGAIGWAISILGERL